MIRLVFRNEERETCCRICSVFCDGLEKTGGGVCSVFDIGDFLDVFI